MNRRQDTIVSLVPWWGSFVVLFETFNLFLMQFTLPQSVQQYVRLELAHCYWPVDPPDPALASRAFRDFVVYLPLSQLAVALLAAVFGCVAFRVYCFLPRTFHYFLGK